MAEGANIRKGFLNIRIVEIAHGNLRWTKPIGEVVVDMLNQPFKWVVMEEKGLCWRVVP